MVSLEMKESCSGISLSGELHYDHGLKKHKANPMGQSDMERFVSDLQKDPKLEQELISYILQQLEFELTEEQLDTIVGGIKNPQHIKTSPCPAIR